MLYATSTYLISLNNSSPTSISNISASTANAGFPYATIQHVEHSMIYDPVRERMVIFSPGKWENNDTGTFVLSTKNRIISKWEELSVTGTLPSERAESATCYDCNKDRMWLFGGEPGPPSIGLNDLWYLDFSTGGAAWNQVSPLGDIPRERGAHDMAYLAYTDELLVIGGRVNNNSVTWAEADYMLKYNISTNTWTKLSPSGSGPSYIHEHSVTAIDGCRVIVGSGYTGNDTANPYSFIKIYNITTNQWENVTISGSVPPTSARTGVYSFDPDEKAMYYFGGENSGNGVWKLTGF